MKRNYIRGSASYNVNDKFFNGPSATDATLKQQQQRPIDWSPVGSAEVIYMNSSRKQLGSFIFFFLHTTLSAPSSIQHTDKVYRTLVESKNVER